MSVRTNFRLPDDLVERMRVEAKKYGATLTDVVIFAIQEYLKLREKKGGAV